MRRSGLINRISTRRRVAEEVGFTIIEASVAMLVAAMMFTALSAGLMSGLKAVRDARLYQQATSIGDEGVEKARNVQYETLAMSTTDLTGDSRIEPGPTFDPDGSGPLEAEPIVHTASGATIDPHRQPQTVGNTTFVTWQYVTWVDEADQGGPGQSYKRMTVIVEWQVGSKTNSYRTSSFIARARRGLPVPKFELAPESQTVKVEQGNLVEFPHTIRNLGIVDTYDLTMPNSKGWVINFYKDSQPNGTFEPGLDPLLLDTNSTGVPDTGSVATDQITYFLAVFLLAPNETPGPVTLTLTATSGANDTVSHSAADTVDIGVVGLTLNLHNNPTPPTGNTVAQANMSMDIIAGSAATLYMYSTDHYPPGGSSQPGRLVDIKSPAATHTESSTRYMANWIHQVPQNTLFSGSAELRFWVAAKNFRCDKILRLRVFIRTKDDGTSSAGTQLASGDVTIPAPLGSGLCGFRQFILTMPLATTILANKWVELKITTRNTSQDAALIAYDTATYNSTLELPQVSA